MIDLTKLVTAAQKTEAATDEKKKADNEVHKSYLESTDWMVMRFLETGKAIPTGVAALRQAARTKIV